MALSQLRNRFSRRQALGLMAVSASGLLAACSGATPPAAPAAKPTEAAKPAGGFEAVSGCVSCRRGACCLAGHRGLTGRLPRSIACRITSCCGRRAAAPAPVKKLGGELRLHMRAGSEDDTLNEVLPKFTADTGIRSSWRTSPPPSTSPSSRPSSPAARSAMSGGAPTATPRASPTTTSSCRSTIWSRPTSSISRSTTRRDRRDQVQGQHRTRCPSSSTLLRRALLQRESGPGGRHHHAGQAGRLVRRADQPSPRSSP